MKRFFSYFSRAKEFYITHERRITFVALLSGFVIDNLTLKRIDLFFENLVLISYLVIGGAAITFINIYDSGKVRNRIGAWLRLISPVAIQFAFGGLFSAFFIFYFRSASVSASWPFILFLVFMMIGNELFIKKFEKMTFQVSVYFIALFSFFIFFIPVLVGKIGLPIFLLSSVVSLVTLIFFVSVLAHINPEVFYESRKRIYAAVSGIILIVSLLYIFNIIPPIPLSVKTKVVAYDITRLSTGDYQVFTQVRPWYEKFYPKKDEYISNGSPLYVFSSVFAPTDFNTDIVHEWQFKSVDGWETMSRISFPVTGGADRGYRGYSVKYNIVPGEWRVNIETPSGATISRINFEVESINILPEVEEKRF